MTNLEPSKSKRTLLMYTLAEFNSNWDLKLKPINCNDLIVVMKDYEIVKVLQDGKNIILN